MARVRPFAIGWGQALGRPFTLDPDAEIHDLTAEEFFASCAWLDLARRLEVCDQLGPGWSERARRFLMRDSVYTTGGRGNARTAFFAAAGLAFPHDGPLQARLLSWLTRVGVFDLERLEVLYPAWRASCPDPAARLGLEAWFVYHEGRSHLSDPERVARRVAELRAELRELGLPASFSPTPLLAEVARYYPNQIALLDYAEGRALLRLGRGTQALLSFSDLEAHGDAFPDERWRAFQLEAQLRDALSRGDRLRPVGLAGLALYPNLPRIGQVLRHALGVIWCCRAELEPSELAVLADALEANRGAKKDPVSALQAAWIREQLGQGDLARSLLAAAQEAAEESSEELGEQVRALRTRIEREPGPAAWSEIPRFIRPLAVVPD